MHPDPRITNVRTSQQAVERLANVGLVAEDLLEAALAGQDEAAIVTANDVVTRAGYVRWATPLRVLGDLYVPRGWSRQRPGGFEILLDPSGSCAIAVAPGNDATGTERMPRVAAPRGPLTGQAVLGNHGQLRFYDVVQHPAFAAADAPAWTTWLLLHYVDEQLGILRTELSMPVAFDASDSQLLRGTVTHFEPRILLPAVELTSGRPLGDDDDGGGSGAIDVPVERRPS